MRNAPDKKALFFATLESGRCRICGSAVFHAGEVDGFRFVECPECAFLFTPQVRPEIGESLYAAGYHGSRDGAPAFGWANTEFLKPAFDRLPQAPLTILDYGCGESVVPQILRGAGHRVTAVDVAPPSKPDPDRLTGSIQELDLGRGRFDLVYAFQVFEHLPQPRPIFDRLLELTAPGGLLLIHTDMETPERARRLDEWWYVTPPDHCAFYRPVTFERMLGQRPAAMEWSDAKTVLIRKRGGRR